MSNEQRPTCKTERPQTATLQTRSQTYAKKAYEKVKAVTGENDAFREEYAALAKSLPFLIRSAGLAQALAFVDAKAKGEEANKPKPKAWNRLLADLNQIMQAGNPKALVQAGIEADLFEYMHLTRKTLEALVWFKRFSESVLDVKKNQPLKVDAPISEAPANNPSQLQV